MNDEFLPAEDGQPDEEEVKAPFMFKVMIVLTVVYLGWRLIQGIVWLIERITS